MFDDLSPIVEKIDLVLLELSVLRESGPHFHILHRFREYGTLCHPGEEITAIFLRHRGKVACLRLPLALRLLFEFLARHRHIPQSAVQIVGGMRNDLFFRRHGANAKTDVKQTRFMSRSAIKEYVKRIRRCLQLAFREVGLTVRPDEVLLSVRTVGNEVLYRLKATADWQHIADISGGNT
jgi:hypothetical protein